MQHKNCSKCDQLKSYDCFNRNKNKKDGLSSQCKKCAKEYRATKLKDKFYAKSFKKRNLENNRRRRHEIQKLIHDYLLKHSCVKCGESNPLVLEFDHIDPKNKKYSINRMISTYSWDTILKEIGKCQVLCTNCHLIKTSTHQRWYSLLDRPWETLSEDNKRRYRNRSRTLEFLKKHSCIDCDENNPIVLTFDHKDPSNKKYGIASLLGKSSSWGKIHAEIIKCDVRCGNCHKIRTSQQQKRFHLNTI